MQSGNYRRSIRGGRGSASGISVKGVPYGSDYHTVLQSGNIKFVKQNKGGSTTSPMETMTKNRVYVTVAEDNHLKSIVYFDSNNKRKKQLDLDHIHENLNEHVHHGYFHNENDGKKGCTGLSPKEKEMVARVRQLWYNFNNNS